MIKIPVEFQRLAIPEVVSIRPIVFEDPRGYFMEIYKNSQFRSYGITKKPVQINVSYSVKNVLRGLHYQKGKAVQGKIVTCVKGEVFDVAVDIRKDSPTYGKWVSIILSAKEKNLVYIPRGFAHGFYTLSDDAEIVYFLDNEHNPKLESGIRWNDPTIKIKWPLKGEPVISEKDKKWPNFGGVD